MAWKDVESSKGQYRNLARYDDAIAKAAASGAKVIVTVYTAPSWASGQDNPESPPLNPADYADFMRFVADRYRGQVSAWEIWNEQNTQRFWSTGPDPAAYARLVRAAYPAVKAADPNAVVVYGGTWENDYEFLERAYAEVPNLGDYFDVLGTHPYNGVTSPDQVELGPNGRIAKWSFAGYRELRATMLAHGDDKPIWLTEFGWATFDGQWGVSEATQAEFLSRAYACAEQDPYVGVAIWYAYRNHPTGADSPTWEHQLGLTRTDFSHKLAYERFKSYTPGGGGCTYPQTSPAASTEPVSTPALPTLPPANQTTAPAGTELTGVTQAPSLRSPMLAVRRAVIRRGQLVVDGRVAHDATGTVRGLTSYGGEMRSFRAPIASDGTFEVRKRLPADADASFAWVGLVYAENERFNGQWVVLQAARRSPQLRVLPDAQASSATRTKTVQGTVAPDARGSVTMTLVYRRADGSQRAISRRSAVRGGSFRQSFRLPLGARKPVLYTVFPGDPLRDIGGSSRILSLR